MDLISHTLTGVAVGTVASSFSQSKWYAKLSIIVIGSFGGALPDLDAISLWSKFDSTIGKFLDLDHTGSQIYCGKFWYSHHGAFHSIITPILLCFIWFVLSIFIHKYSIDRIRKHTQQNTLKYLAFLLGFLFHLLEDMLTPAAFWGGVNFFFPSDQYIGGFGKIWWWNNYDIVLIIFSVIIINLIINLIHNHYYKIRQILTTFVMCLGIGLSIFQMMNRPIDFSYVGHSSKYHTYEKQSKKIQKDILGTKLYNIMVEIDNMIPLYF